MAEDLRARLAAAALDQRGASYRWLRENFATIAEVFETQARSSWKMLAQAATESGVECTPDTLRKAWPLVLRDLSKTGRPRIERGRKKSAETPSPMMPEPEAWPVPADPAAVNEDRLNAPDSPDEAAKPKHTWTPTRLK